MSNVCRCKGLTGIPGGGSPGTVTPGTNTNLQTTLTYDSSWTLVSLTGPNGDSGGTRYDGAGRPSATTMRDGAVTTYSYSTQPNQQTATLGTGTTARWKRTTMDGFGRVTRVETGNGATTNTPVSQVDTEYAPCACSPLGKLYRVSAPYAPNGTRVWAATYAYDGIGRTISVTAADGSVTTTEYLTSYGSYTGNLVRVTDPARNWKIQKIDVLGNLITVIEPDPAGGADWTTTYAYDPLGHVTDVTMPRSNGTQARHFAYGGLDLISATNPENGTVLCEYDGARHVTKRTDAKQQETRYSYDDYGRLLQVQHWMKVQNPQTFQWVLTEQVAQRATYHYDTNPLGGITSQNAMGRLAAVEFRDAATTFAMTYEYSYNQAGRVLAQHMNYDGRKTFDATYAWDTEGRMTSTNYGPSYTLQYDVNGRLSGMTGSDGNASASYDAGRGGLLTGMSYFGFNESRGYNSLMQMTSQSVGTTTPQSTVLMDMQYVYPTGTNNGRISQTIDGTNGETINYTYDKLNRLTEARTATWGQGYGYDGFGNLTSKTATLGSVPTMNIGADPATNRGGSAFDANGNATSPFDVFDVENHLISQGAGPAVTYGYDPSGKRVTKIASGSEEVYFYGIGGQKLVTDATISVCGTTCNLQTTRSYNVYFGGKVVKSKGVVVATDRLGSVRANSNGESFRCYPYGEERTTTADNREKFGTCTRDSSSQDYADQRYYAVWGWGGLIRRTRAETIGTPPIRPVGTCMPTSTMIRSIRLIPPGFATWSSAALLKATLTLRMLRGTPPPQVPFRYTPTAKMLTAPSGWEMLLTESWMWLVKRLALPQAPMRL